MARSLPHAYALCAEWLSLDVAEVERLLPIRQVNAQHPIEIWCWHAGNRCRTQRPAVEWARDRLPGVLLPEVSDDPAQQRQLELRCLLRHYRLLRILSQPQKDNYNRRYGEPAIVFINAVRGLLRLKPIHEREESTTDMRFARMLALRYYRAGEALRVGSALREDW